ncbi:uncharacterized protein C8A04DRAFT_26731 [Dichotomopilus funicola]|uniref:Uncharacterized protein n=1 Tax=Dichotomopilus funicola TaxID=1934379 RepID=A0AAN6ZNY2_9PEZI|nr:hypothetical protein C8A04DRAFT_26731 [Dichotomopilus funicola]
MLSDSPRDRRGASSLTAYDSGCSVTGTVILKRDISLGDAVVSRGQRVVSLPLGVEKLKKRKRASRRSSSWSLDSTDGQGRTLDWPFDKDTGRSAGWPLPPSHKAGPCTTVSPSPSQGSEPRLSRTTDSSSETPSDTPPEKKLRLKVSRGALVKQRGRPTGPSSTSYSTHTHRYRYPTPRRNHHHHHHHSITSNNQPSLRTRTRHQPTQPQKRHAGNPPKTKDLILQDLLTTSPSHSRVNGRALRRLMNRFPDLERRVVAMSDLDVGFLAARRGGDGVGHDAGGRGYDDGERVEGDWDLRRLRRGARLKGRVVGWVRRVKEVVLGGGAKSTYRCESKFKPKFGSRPRRGLRLGFASRWGRRR